MANVATRPIIFRITGAKCQTFAITVIIIIVINNGLYNVYFQILYVQYCISSIFAFRALTLLVWRQEEHPDCKN